MKIIFFGLGHAGQRHMKILQRDHDDFLLYAFRTGLGQSRCDLGGYTEISSWDEVDIIRPDIAFICNPPHCHLDTAYECAKRGMHIFLEKPIGEDDKWTPQTRWILREKGLTCYVAYPLRFHPRIQQIKQATRNREVLYAELFCGSYYPEWHVGEQHKLNYTAQEEMGGGALLDLSHESYLAEWLFGKVDRVYGVRRRRTQVTVDTDDLACLIMEHASGSISTVHLDLFSKPYRRYVEVVFTNDVYRFRWNLEFDEKTTDEMFTSQMNYFFSVIGYQEFDGSFFDCESLFHKLCKVRRDNLIL